MSKYFSISTGLRGAYLPDTAYVVKIDTRRDLKAAIAWEAASHADAGFVGASKRAVAWLLPPHGRASTGLPRSICPTACRWPGRKVPDTPSVSSWPQQPDPTISTKIEPTSQKGTTMGTRSDIIVHREDGKWHRIYCHWDGYLSHNGQILFEHYTTQKQAETLVAPGDMSSLAPKCSKPKGHSFDKAVKGYCVYYGRDRGEKDVAGKLGDSLLEVWPPEDTWTEFTYIWDEGCWWVADPDEGTQTLINLGDALMGKKTLRPKVKAFGMVIGQHATHNPKSPDDHSWSGPKTKA